MKLTPEDLQRIEEKKVANILRKIYTEKRTPTAREDAILQRTGVPQTPGEETPTGGYAHTWEELADACHVDRRTLTNARTNFGNEIKAAEKEWSRADGRKEIAWWIRFLDAKGIRGRGVNNPDIDFIDERALRLRREKFQLLKAEWEFEKAKESMLPVAEYEAALSATIGAFLTTLNQVPGRASQKIVSRARIAVVDMLRGVLTAAQFAKVEAVLDSASIEYGEIQQILELELEHVRSTLAQCEYLAEEPHEPANKVDGGDQNGAQNQSAPKIRPAVSHAAEADTGAAACPSPRKPAPSSGASSRAPSRRRRANPSGGSSKK